MSISNFNKNKPNLILSLEKIVEDIILKLSSDAHQIDSMSFEELLKSVQLLTRTFQNFIKILEITSRSQFDETLIQDFTSKIINDNQCLQLAEELLIRLEKVSTDKSVLD